METEPKLEIRIISRLSEDSVYLAYGNEVVQKLVLVCRFTTITLSLKAPLFPTGLRSIPVRLLIFLWLLSPSSKRIYRLFHSPNSLLSYRHRKISHDVLLLPHSLVSTYVVCERLSVMHKQGRLTEIFDQIAQNTPVLEFGSRTPPPQIEI